MLNEILDRIQLLVPVYVESYSYLFSYIGVSNLISSASRSGCRDAPDDDVRRFVSCTGTRVIFEWSILQLMFDHSIITIYHNV